MNMSEEGQDVSASAESKKISKAQKQQKNPEKSVQIKAERQQLPAQNTCMGV